MKYSAIVLSKADEVAQWFGVRDHNTDNLSSSPGVKQDEQHIKVVF